MIVERRFAKRIDYGMIVLVLALFAVGCVAIYSASRSIVPMNPFHFVKRQLMWGIVSFLAFSFMMFTDYRVWQKWVWVIYFVNMGLLLGVLFTAKEVGGSQRWFRYGGIGIQPSEFSKLAVIIALACFLQGRDAKDPKVLLGAFGCALGPMILIVRQPDLGTALVFIVILMGMLFLAGAQLKHLALITGVGCLLAIVFTVASLQGWIHGLEPYQIKRILVFLDPWDDPTGFGWNVIQSMIAVGSGGLQGKGFLDGSQTQLNFLPSHYTDFIFSVIGEEFGFIGALCLLCLFFSLICHLVRVVACAADRFGLLISGGVLFMISFHVLLNIAVAIGLAPVTGIPLPFISYGGSSLLTNMLGLGLAASVYMRRDKLMLN